MLAILCSYLACAVLFGVISHFLIQVPVSKLCDKLVLEERIEVKLVYLANYQQSRTYDFLPNFLASVLLFPAVLVTITAFGVSEYNEAKAELRIQKIKEALLSE